MERTRDSPYIPVCPNLTRSDIIFFYCPIHRHRGAAVVQARVRTVRTCPRRQQMSVVGRKRPCVRSMSIQGRKPPEPGQIRPDPGPRRTATGLHRRRRQAIELAGRWSSRLLPPRPRQARHVMTPAGGTTDPHPLVPRSHVRIYVQGIHVRLCMHARTDVLCVRYGVLFFV